MNETELDQNTIDLSEITPRLISGIDIVLERLIRDKLPSVNDIDSLQQLLDRYIKVLNEQEEKEQVSRERQQVVVTMARPSVKYTATDVIADIRSDPQYLQILFFIGLRKIARMSDIPFSADKIENLFHKGYLTVVQIDLNQSDASEYYTLTVKGWSCFTSESITQQLKNSLGMTAVFIPTELSVDQTKWTEETYQRAVMIQQYYGGISANTEYMIFSYPENEAILFGCMAEKSKTADYVCAVLKSDAVNEANQNILSNVLRADGVGSITLIADSEDDAKRWASIISVSGQEKLKFVEAALGGRNV